MCVAGNVKSCLTVITDIFGVPRVPKCSQWMVENMLGLLQATETSGTVSAVRQEQHRDIAKHCVRPLGVLEGLSGWHLITFYRSDSDHTSCVLFL